MCLVHAVTRAGIRDQRDLGSVFIPNQWLQWKMYFCLWILTGKICLHVSEGRKIERCHLFFLK